jgi:tetratricopeptide (TPR) repeat protein
VESYKQILKSAPDDFNVRMMIATQLASLDRLPEAIQQYQDMLAIKTAPAGLVPEIRAKLAALYEKTGQPSKAVEQYRELLKADPKNASAASALKRLGA